ncbi:hypothetical protein ABVT39_019373 [Epinephelus coioides]
MAHYSYNTYQYRPIRHPEKLPAPDKDELYVEEDVRKTTSRILLFTFLSQMTEQANSESFFFSKIGICDGVNGLTNKITKQNSHHIIQLGAQASIASLKSSLSPVSLTAK